MEIVPYVTAGDAPAIFEQLLDQGLTYRYPLDRWQALEGGGKPFASPTRLLDVNGESVVEELIQPALTAAVLSQPEWQALTDLTKSLCRVFEAIATNAPAILTLPSVAPFADALVDPIEQAHLYDPVPGPWRLPFLRFDALYDAGQWTVIDVNSTRPAGVGDYHLLNAAAQGCRPELTAPPLGEALVRVVFNAALSWDRSLVGRCSVVVADRYADIGNMQVLRELLSREPWFDGIALQTIDEFAAWPTDCRLILRGRIKPRDGAAFDTLVAGYPTDRLVLSPPYQRFAGNKLWSALIHAPQLAGFLASRIGWEAVRSAQAALPATVLLAGEPVAGLSVGATTGAARKGYVLKPPAGSSAKGVRFGRDMSGLRWEQALVNGGGPSVLQPYRDVRQRHLLLAADGTAEWRELPVKFGIFALGGQLAGLELMLRPSRLVHGARDTYLVPVLIERSLEPPSRCIDATAWHGMLQALGECGPPHALSDDGI